MKPIVVQRVVVVMVVVIMVMMMLWKKVPCFVRGRAEVRAEGLVARRVSRWEVLSGRC